MFLKRGDRTSFFFKRDWSYCCFDMGSSPQLHELDWEPLRISVTHTFSGNFRLFLNECKVCSFHISIGFFMYKTVLTASFVLWSFAKSALKLFSVHALLNLTIKWKMFLWLCHHFAGLIDWMIPFSWFHHHFAYHFLVPFPWFVLCSLTCFVYLNSHTYSLNHVHGFYLDISKGRRYPWATIFS